MKNDSDRYLTEDQRSELAAESLTGRTIESVGIERAGSGLGWLTLTLDDNREIQISSTGTMGGGSELIVEVLS